ncbi:MAG TPA: hypothetical protein PK380_12540 [Deltaproteobacteria bacterium]|nr:hypothetical protein [Deltaproteobacteria bacterium]
MKIFISDKLSDAGVEILGEAGITIAGLLLGRGRLEDTAIIDVDTEVPKKVMDKLRWVPNAPSVQEAFI